MTHTVEEEASHYRSPFSPLPVLVSSRLITRLIPAARAVDLLKIPRYQAKVASPLSQHIGRTYIRYTDPSKKVFFRRHVVGERV